MSLFLCVCVLCVFCMTSCCCHDSADFPEASWIWRPSLFLSVKLCDVTLHRKSAKPHICFPQIVALQKKIVKLFTAVFSLKYNWAAEVIICCFFNSTCSRFKLSVDILWSGCAHTWFKMHPTSPKNEFLKGFVMQLKKGNEFCLLTECLHFFVLKEFYLKHSNYDTKQCCNKRRKHFTDWDTDTYISFIISLNNLLL